ncbi:PepSY domain-containing protein [Azorhizophilus paspali]|uniref:PepSY domain-containing protein n=1 Tax=Azorhizophilus paspali TaxID=69963 RepID=UPI0036457770
MKVRGFRQANAWLHNWTGLLLGWLLYAIFLTGTLCFFQNEITLWMKPEQHGSHPDAGSAERAWATLQRLAPTAEQWRIQLPGERNTAIQVNWSEPGQEKDMP